MIESPFRITGLEADSTLAREAGALFDAPENIEARQPYDYVKMIEADIEKLRSMMSEEDVAAYENDLSGLSAVEIAKRVLRGLVKRPRPLSLKARLVEHESYIGGDIPLFKDEEGNIKKAGVQSQRFWYVDGFWYYEETDAQGEMVANYQVIDGQLVKIDGAKHIPFAEGEEAGLEAAIRQYYAAIQDKLYQKKIQA